MKKIMFNDRYGLTQAVLDGRKTMTRRIVSESLWDKWTEYDDFCGSVGVGGLAEIGVAVTREYSNCEKFFLDNSPLKIGEIVAIAQSYESIYHRHGLETMDMFVTELKNHKGWRNKMFVKDNLMPHLIRITDIRVERLQDISDDDCINEGIYASNSHEIGYGIPWVYSFDGTNIAYYTPREAYAALIDKVSGKGTWDSNPFVFVYGFELIK